VAEPQERSGYPTNDSSFRADPQRRPLGQSPDGRSPFHRHLRSAKARQAHRLLAPQQTLINARNTKHLYNESNVLNSRRVEWHAKTAVRRRQSSHVTQNNGSPKQDGASLKSVTRSRSSRKVISTTATADTEGRTSEFQTEHTQCVTTGRHRQVLPVLYPFDTSTCRMYTTACIPSRSASHYEKWGFRLIVFPSGCLSR
jgi:hypothetical protein